MMMSASQLPTKSRRGLTLLEITLVLVIIAVIAAMVLPRLVGTATSYRLRLAAQKTQAGLTQARNQALKNGRASIFACVESGQTYAVIPTTVDAQGLERAMSSVEPFLSMTPDELDTMRSQTEGLTGARLSRLPMEVTITAVHVVNTVSPPIAAPSTTSPITSTISSNVSQIRFLPDGTSTDALIVLSNNRDQSIGVVLRGITGTSSITEIASGAMSSQGGSR